MKSKHFFPTATLLCFVATAMFFTACQPQAAVNPDAANEVLMQSISEMELDLWNNGNMAQLEHIYTADFTRTDPFGTVKGAEAFKANYDNIKKTYPDLKVSFKDSWVKGDKMTVLWHVDATHSGPFGEGMPATGKPISVDGVDIFELKDGKVANQWVFFDQASVFAQTGYTIHPPVTAAAAPTPTK